jgi:hypothetical protein
VREGSKYARYAYELRAGQDPKAPIALLKEYQDYGGGKIGTFFKGNTGAFLFIAGVSYPPLGLAIVTAGAIAGTIQENRSKYSSQPNKANTDSQDATESTEDHQTDTLADSTA